MCAARHDPRTFEFVARMGRLAMETGDDDEESKKRVPLSFIMPALPPRQEKLGRNQRACKSVDLPVAFQHDGDTQKQFHQRSSEESMEIICEIRKKHSQDRTGKEIVSHSAQSNGALSNGAPPNSSPPPSDASHVF